MGWRLAKSLDALRKQVNDAFPARDKSSDGTIGDAAHSASKSEHNPDKNGVVRAMDITNDPAHGVNARALAEALIASRDPRILYVISNGQINSSEKAPWTWRPYTGVNAHRHHVHISVAADPKLYDDVRPWAIKGGVAVPLTPVPTPAPSPGTPAPAPAPALVSIEDVQRALNAHGAAPPLNVDGDFGQKSRKAVLAALK